jgi:hypothetical protein
MSHRQHDHASSGSQTFPPSPDVVALLQQGQRLAQDAEALASDARSTALSFRAWSLRTVATSPFAVVGVAAAVGYVLAGGLTTPFTRLVVRSGGRLLIASAVRRVAETLLQPPAR